MGNVVKFKVSVSNLEQRSLNRVREINLKKLNDMKLQGKTKEMCYPKFTKIFVDNNYGT